MGLLYVHWYKPPLDLSTNDDTRRKWRSKDVTNGLIAAHLEVPLGERTARGLGDEDGKGKNNALSATSQIQPEKAPFQPTCEASRVLTLANAIEVKMAKA
jgi:hypothetical protein